MILIEIIEEDGEEWGSEERDVISAIRDCSEYPQER